MTARVIKVGRGVTSAKKLARHTQASVDVLQYEIDYSRWLADGETLNSFTFTVEDVTSPALAVTNAAIDIATHSLLTYFISGGVTGTKYTVTVKVTTSGGQTFECYFEIRIKDPPQVVVGNTPVTPALLDQITSTANTALAEIEGSDAAAATSATSSAASATAAAASAAQAAVIAAGLGGVLTNVSVAKTAAYSVVNADKGKTLALGGNAYYGLTFGAASGYDSNFAVLVTNTDTGRAKYIVMTGGATFRLWPLQTVAIYNIGNSWVASPSKQEWLISTSLPVFHVDNVAGSDSITVTDGLSTGAAAFLTVQNAMNTIQQMVFTPGAGSGVHIQLPTTTSTPITEQCAWQGAMPQGIVQTSIIGNTATPTLCQWELTGTSQSAITVDDYASMGVSGIGFSSAGTGNTFINAGHGQHVILDLSFLDFGPNPSGVNVGVGPFTDCNFGQGLSISGGAIAMVNAPQSGHVGFAPGIAINAAAAFTFFLIGNNGSRFDTSQLSFTGSTTLITGQKHQILNGSIIAGDSAVTWPVNMTAGQSFSGSITDHVPVTANDAFGNTFARLPANPIVGYVRVVSDANVSVVGASVTSGGGGNSVLVWYSGAAWVIIGVIGSSLTAHAVLLGAGASGVGLAAIGTAGRLLIDQGAAADPAFTVMSGDATIAANGAVTIAANAVTNAKAAQMAAGTIKGNITGVAANAADLTIAQVQSALKQPYIVITAAGVNFNAVADTALAFTMPSGFTRIVVDEVLITNPSHTLTTAAFGVFGATGGAGAAWVAGGTAITVSATADQTANNMQRTASVAISAVAASLATPNTIYFRVTNAEGAAATADITAILRIAL